VHAPPVSASSRTSETARSCWRSPRRSGRINYASSCTPT
jgi:hypothetical protein